MRWFDCHRQVSCGNFRCGYQELVRFLTAHGAPRHVLLFEGGAVNQVKLCARAKVVLADCFVAPIYTHKKDRSTSMKYFADQGEFSN